MFEALAEWMGYCLYYTAYGRSAPGRTVTSHAAIAPDGPYASGDGKMVYLGIENEREWVRFGEQVLKRPDLCNDPRFGTNSSRVEMRQEQGIRKQRRQKDSCIGAALAPIKRFPVETD